MKTFSQAIIEREVQQPLWLQKARTLLCPQEIPAWTVSEKLNNWKPFLYKNAPPLTECLQSRLAGFHEHTPGCTTGHSAKMRLIFEMCRLLLLKDPLAGECVVKAYWAGWSHRSERCHCSSRPWKHRELEYTLQGFPSGFLHTVCDLSYQVPTLAAFERKPSLMHN